MGLSATYIATTISSDWVVHQGAFHAPWTVWSPSIHQWSSLNFLMFSPSVGSVDLSSVIWRGVILFVCPVDTNICGYCSIPFFKLIVPTVDTVRYSYLTSSLIAKFHPVLLVGPVGTGKTSVAETVINSLDAKTYSVLVVNMSAQVSHHEKLKKFWKFQYKLNK